MLSVLALKMVYPAGPNSTYWYQSEATSLLLAKMTVGGFGA
jgi:hypothetical protein